MLPPVGTVGAGVHHGGHPEVVGLFWVPEGVPLLEPWVQRVSHPPPVPWVRVVALEAVPSLPVGVAHRVACDLLAGAVAVWRYCRRQGQSCQPAHGRVAELAVRERQVGVHAALGAAARGVAVGVAERPNRRDGQQDVGLVLGQMVVHLLFEMNSTMSTQRGTQLTRDHFNCVDSSYRHAVTI